MCTSDWIFSSWAIAQNLQLPFAILRFVWGFGNGCAALKFGVSGQRIWSAVVNADKLSTTTDKISVRLSWYRFLYFALLGCLIFFTFAQFLLAMTLVVDIYHPMLNDILAAHQCNASVGGFFSPVVVPILLSLFYAFLLFNGWLGSPTEVVSPVLLHPSPRNGAPVAYSVSVSPHPPRSLSPSRPVSSSPRPVSSLVHPPTSLMTTKTVSS